MSEGSAVVLVPVGGGSHFEYWHVRRATAAPAPCPASAGAQLPAGALGPRCRRLSAPAGQAQRSASLRAGTANSGVAAPASRSLRRARLPGSCVRALGAARRRPRRPHSRRQLAREAPRAPPSTEVGLGWELAQLQAPRALPSPGAACHLR